MIASVVLLLRLLLAVALYAFLGWALWTLLQELKQQGDKLAMQKKPTLTLHFKIGEGKESVQHFEQSEIMIGRDTNCDLSMMDEALSAHHARLTHEMLMTPAVVITGDHFKCGNTVFDIGVEDDVEAPFLITR